MIAYQKPLIGIKGRLQNRKYEADGEVKYRFDVKITNMDKYYGVMSLVPGYKHKTWGTIAVVDVSTNAPVCEVTFEELTGGRDFAIDDSFLKCMSDLGKALAKIK